MSDLVTALDKCVDDLKKVHALPPYNHAGNLNAGDSYFLRKIYERYHPEIVFKAKMQIEIVRKKV